MKNKKLALFKSAVCLLLCISMLAGSTFAWFTDEVKSGINTIAAGNLDVELYHSNAAVSDQRVKNDTLLFMDLQGKPILWEPGVVSFENLRVANEGDLALRYQLTMETANENYIVYPDGTLSGLSQALKVGVVEGGITATDRAGVLASVSDANWTTLASFLRSGELLPQGKGEAEKTWGIVIYWEPGENDNLWNLNNGKQLDQGEALSIDLGVKLIATQFTSEQDSFGSDYDQNAIFPGVAGGSVSADVTVENGIVTAAATLQGDGFKAIVPAGTKLAEGVSRLTLTVREKDSSDANLKLSDEEALCPLDVHIEGTAPDNTQPILVTIEKAMTVGLNIGNYKLYHVENGTPNEMTAVAAADLDAHNEFTYDPATGDITLALASFSEVAMVAEEPKWEGNRDYDWYTNAVAPVDGDGEVDYVIANADQLAAFGAIVGGMDGQTQDSFKDKTVKLIADINIGDMNSENKFMFYPIGYYNNTDSYTKQSGNVGPNGAAISSGFRNFEGTFDGNGHTISNFYQNTWEAFGDYNDGYSGTPNHNRDGFGLFGKVYGGTVKNLTVMNFESDGEYATTGVIAAYAEGATFENIAIFECNPRVYNIGNGGIVGCVGWYAKEADLKTTFTNITVDNSNKISALWGSYDVACGGIVGQYYPTSGQSSAKYPKNGGIDLINCHVSAQMDVYNDVCGNYQYYAYRYAGMLIGSIRENETTADGKTIPKMEGITATGCTVNYGNWNGYFYCELVANSLASYTHDHQFSRLDQIADINTQTMEYLPMGETEWQKIPTSGRVNYVIVTGERSTENAECYHFVDGKVHDHKDYNGDGKEDFETVNGESVYVENNWHIYLPFYQLYTGYGWGVSSIGLEKYSGVITDLDIKEADFEGSEPKFKFIGANSYSADQPLSIGSLFEGTSQDIKNSQVQVFVSPVGENSNVSAVYVSGKDSGWENGTLTFSGTGAATITITDYYFCTPTTITVNVTERQAAEKFKTKFTGDFLYRVGSNEKGNTVELGTIFKAVDGATIGNVAVTVEALDGTAASGTYTANSTWTKGKIAFSGTGVVKVTITDNDYCTPTVLFLEVVDAKNITTASGSTDGTSVVLLKDVNASDYVNYKDCTLYGNGFTYSLSGAPNAYNSKQGHGILLANNATFDNVVVVGDVYTSYGAYTNQSYYNAAIQATETTIQNCYVANCATPVRGNGVTIIDSTLYGGTVASLVLSGGTNTLKNVTTVNYNDDRNILGLGIVVNDDASDNTRIVLEGSLKQYNYVCQSDSSKVPGTEAKALFNSMFNFDDYKTSTGYVNTGIVIMNEALNSDIITGSITGYKALDDASITLSVYGVSKTVNGAVYAPIGEGVAVDNNYDYAKDNHVATKQSVYLPEYDFVLGNYFDANDGENDTRYCYESINNKEVRLLYLDGQEGFTFDLSKLAVATKFGHDLSASVTCKNSSGTILATNSTVTLKDAGMYSFEITVTDNIIYGTNGVRTGETVKHTYMIDVELSVKKASWKNAEIKLSAPTTTSGYNSSKYYVLEFLTAISITDYSEDGTAESVDLKAEYESYEVTYVDSTSYAWSGFTLTINYKDGRVLTVTFGKPSSLSSPGASAGGKTISLKKDTTYGYLLQSDGKINSKVSGTWPITKCTFKGANTVTVENTKSVDITVDKNTTIKITAPSSGDDGSDDDCVTGDTLITLADGTQKRIDQLTYQDELLVWDFYNGCYATTTASVIFNHGTGIHTVTNLNFSDGTTVGIIGEHEFFDVESNSFVNITEQNVANYIGRKFVKANGEGYSYVKLMSYHYSEEEIGNYTILTAKYNNAIVEGMLSLTPDPTNKCEDFFRLYEVGEGMKYDQKKMQADIEKYGLFAYEDLAAYVTYEEFVAFNGEFYKILVGKGLITVEDIVMALATYAPNH